MPAKPDTAMPQQRQLAATIDLDSFIAEAENKLKCDVKGFVQAGRLSGPDKYKRDFLVYYICRTGQLSNKQIGNLFGISYSAVSHIVRAFNAKLKKDQRQQIKFNQFNSLFTL